MPWLQTLSMKQGPCKYTLCDANIVKAPTSSLNQANLLHKPYMIYCHDCHLCVQVHKLLLVGNKGNILLTYPKSFFILCHGQMRAPFLRRTHLQCNTQCRQHNILLQLAPPQVNNGDIVIEKNDCVHFIEIKYRR